MVPTNALQRTFQISSGSAAATAFTIDVDGRQYLVTAKHVLEGNEELQSPVEIWHDGQWKTLPCKLVGLTAGDVDVAVLAPQQQLSPTFPLRPSHEGLFLSQEAFFLGFPFGYRSDLGQINSGFPIPLVKRACVSLVDLVGQGTRLLLLDGHNNVGFSGGPVVFARRGLDTSTVNVAAVVTSYRSYLTPVLERDGKTETGHVVEDNSGIVEAHSIDYALALIRENPIGFALQAA